MWPRRQRSQELFIGNAMAGLNAERAAQIKLFLFFSSPFYPFIPLGKIKLLLMSFVFRYVILLSLADIQN
jgi:hypothetical protein